jgi:hypothetical protein
MSEIITVGLDLAKNVFQAHGADVSGRAVLRKKLRRDQVLEFFGQLPACVVAMEACGGAHFWGREIGKLGHEVRLIPPAYVKPFVKRQKNDRRVPTVPRSKQPRNAAANSGSPVAARHDFRRVSAAAWLVRLAQSCGPNGSLRLRSCAIAALCLSQRFRPFLRGVPKCIRCGITLTWHNLSKTVTKLG